MQANNAVGGPRERVRALITIAAVIAGVVIPAPGRAVAASDRGSIFEHPGALTLDSLGHLWVANSDRFGVTEVEAATGREIRIVREPGYTLNDPIAMTVTHNEVWILNGGVTYSSGLCTGGLVVVLDDRTGKLVHTVDLRHQGLRCADAIASDTSEVWVSGASGERLAELSAATGQVERLIYRGRDIVGTDGLAIGNGRIWYSFRDGVAERWAHSGAWIAMATPSMVTTLPNGEGRSTTLLEPTLLTETPDWVFATNQSGSSARLGGSITLFDNGSGRVARIEQPRSAGYENARVIASDTAHVWIANARTGIGGETQGNSIDEYSAITGRLVRLFYLEDGPYSDPWGLASSGRDLFVADQGGGNVLEYSTTTGALVRVIGPPAPAGYSPT